MKKGQTNIALVLLGIVAIVALIGLILLVKKTPTGAVYGGQILWSGPLRWENIFGWMPNWESKGWCMYTGYTNGGFNGVLQREGEGFYRCYAVPPESVPDIYKSYNERYPIACFAEGDFNPPEEVRQHIPIVCDPPRSAFDPFPYQGTESPYYGQT